jgi:hypothetical protein
MEFAPNQPPPPPELALDQRNSLPLKVSPVTGRRGLVAGSLALVAASLGVVAASLGVVAASLGVVAELPECLGVVTCL